MTKTDFKSLCSQEEKQSGTMNKVTEFKKIKRATCTDMMLMDTN